MYERRLHPPISRARFARRLLAHAAVAFAVLMVSLCLGMAGYEHFENLPWLDAFLNSAMLMGGMGPVDPPRTDAGKLFAGCFALYAGLVFIAAAGLVFTPVLHRLLHRFHWEDS